MIAQSEHKATDRRKKYQKPAVRVVELATQEVLAVGCKTATGGTASGKTPCKVPQCAASGTS